MMSQWTIQKKLQFRGQVLTMLAGGHISQNPRMDDVQLCLYLQRYAWDCDIRDVVTIVQDLEGRGYVRFERRRNPVTQRIELFSIEICPEGQDLVDGLKMDHAVSFQ